jgi:hypothetical protein
LKDGGSKKQDIWAKSTLSKKIIAFCEYNECQKLGMILEKRCFKKIEVIKKHIFFKTCATNPTFFIEK